MKTKAYYWLGGIVFVFLIILFLLIYIPSHNGNRVEYKVYGCFKSLSEGYNYFESNKTFVTFVNSNCCGTNITVFYRNKTYVIKEVKTGEICKCFCPKKVVIFDFVNGSKVIFEDWAGNRKEIYSGSETFCGKSTYGPCKTDEDCVIDGCSGQYCRSKEEFPITTTCEWLPCYDYKKFEMSCKCINNKCQWSK